MREFKKLPLELFIGYDIEQNSRVIELDASEMVEKYPSGILQLVCKRPGEETTYIAPSFEQDGGTLRWTLTSYDVEKAGQGLAIVALVDTSEESVKVLASHKIRTGIEEGLHFRDAEKVDPDDSLIARVLAAVSQAQAYAQGAKEEADRAEAALDDVEDAKDQAISDIETKGAETLESIPSDYTALSGDVSDLKSAFDDPNIIGESQATLLTGYSISLTTGKITQGSANVKDIKFAVKGNQVYTMYSPYLNRGGMVINTEDSFVVGNTYTSVRNNIFGNYAEFTTPANAKWMLFNYYTGADVQNLADIKLFEQKMADLNTNIKVKKQNLPSDIVYSSDDGFPPLFDLIKDSLVTLPVSVTLNTGKLLNTNGTVEDHSNAVFCVTDPVDISAYDYLHIGASASWPKAFYAFYDANDVFIIAGATKTEGAISSFSDFVIVPNGAKYIRVSQYSAPTYTPAAVKHIAGISSDSWHNKIWVAIGDSLTQINETTDKRYYDYITDVTGINVLNFGVGGTGYANPNGSAGNFIARMASVPTDADVYTIFGSFNDVAYAISNNIEIGDPSDSGTTTMCGYFNAAFDALLARVPLANLGVIAPCPWQYCYPAGTGQNSTYGKSYVDALKQVCERRSIPYLDLFHYSGMRTWDEDFRTLVYTKDTAGGVHPNEIGHKILSTKFKAFLESLLL